MNNNLASYLPDVHAGIRDVITFQGETIAEFIQAFHDSVDDYLEWCAGRGEEPQMPQDTAAKAS